MAKISSYYPDVIKEIREFKVLAQAEDSSLSIIYEALENIMDDQFIETAKNYGLSRLEKIVEIKPKDTDTLDERRFKILAKYNEDIPYTYRKLVELLNTLCGNDGYVLEINHNEFSLKVKVELKSKKNVKAVEETLERIVPMNMIFNVELRYNQYSTVGKLTHQQLKAYTHKGIREEVLING